jgi:L-ascorbate metabolism protein UlaG (beta-lactamase superfamily)
MMSAATLLALACVIAQDRAAPAPLAVHYVANAGVLLTVDGRKILIDSPIRDGIPPYTRPSEDERARLEGARSPYDGVAAILITHWHEDHFSPDAVAAHLRSSPVTLLITSGEVVDRVRTAAPDLPAARFRPTTPAPGASTIVELEGLRVHVLRIRHNPTRRLPAEHVGFLVQGTKTALHVGDADPAADNFSVLAGLPPVDVALVPFWFLTDAGTATATVARVIRPRHMVGLHLPGDDAEQAARALQERGLRATLLRTPGAIASF